MFGHFGKRETKENFELKVKEEVDRRLREILSYKKETLKKGDEVYFYFRHTHFSNYFKYHKGKISSIKETITDGVSSVKYYIEAKGFSKYDFYVYETDISKNIYTLRKKLLMQDEYMPIHKDSYNQEIELEVI